jgi:hypothetical protein
VLGTGAGGGVHLNTTDGPTVIKITNCMSTAAVGTSHYSRTLHLRAASSHVWANLSNIPSTLILLSTTT